MRDLPPAVRAAAAPLRRRTTALIVPLPAAEPALAAWRAAAGLEPAPVPAHVTVLYPFLPLPGMRLTAGVRALSVELAALAAEIAPFDVTLADLGRFPGVLYLAPRPEQGFLDATAASVRRWPQCPPYAGRFAQVVPHLTVGEGPAADDPAYDAVLQAHLPVVAQARDLVLLVAQQGELVERARFPLGG